MLFRLSTAAHSRGTQLFFSPDHIQQSLLGEQNLPLTDDTDAIIKSSALLKGISYDPNNVITNGTIPDDDLAYVTDDDDVRKQLNANVTAISGKPDVQQGKFDYELTIVVSVDGKDETITIKCKEVSLPENKEAASACSLPWSKDPNTNLKILDFGEEPGSFKVTMKYDALPTQSKMHGLISKYKPLTLANNTAGNFFVSGKDQNPVQGCQLGELLHSDYNLPHAHAYYNGYLQDWSDDFKDQLAGITSTDTVALPAMLHFEINSNDVLYKSDAWDKIWEPSSGGDIKLINRTCKQLENFINDDSYHLFLAVDAAAFTVEEEYTLIGCCGSIVYLGDPYPIVTKSLHDMIFINSNYGEYDKVVAEEPDLTTHLKTVCPSTQLPECLHIFNTTGGDLEAYFETFDTGKWSQLITDIKDIPVIQSTMNYAEYLREFYFKIDSDSTILPSEYLKILMTQGNDEVFDVEVGDLTTDVDITAFRFYCTDENQLVGKIKFDTGKAVESDSRLAIGLGFTNQAQTDITEESMTVVVEQCVESETSSCDVTFLPCTDEKLKSDIMVTDRDIKSRIGWPMNPGP